MSNVLHRLIAGRSWEWAKDLCRSLKLDAQLLDSSHNPVLPWVPAESAQPVLGPTGLRELRAVADRARRDGAARLSHAGGRAVAVLPVRVSGAVIGVLVVTSRASTPPRGELLLRASEWLRGALERHLHSPAAGVDRLSALHRSLQRAAGSGRDREIVNVFAEALAMWHDVEVAGYVQTTRDTFTPVVSLAGDRPRRPIELPPDVLPEPRRMVTVPQTHVDAAGDAARDAALVTLEPVSGSRWLLALTGALDACEPALLEGYVSALDLALGLGLRAATAQLAIAVRADLAATSGPSPAALQRALARTGRAIGASHLKYTMRLPGRAPLSVSTGSEPQATDAPLLRAERRLKGGGVGVLEARTAAAPWTPGERALFLSAADQIEAWLRRFERDASIRVRQTSTEAAAPATAPITSTTTAVVFALAPEAPAEAVRSTLQELVPHVRSSDALRHVSPHEVVVLMTHPTSVPGSAGARRIRAELARTGLGQGVRIAGVGIATRMPGQGAADILAHARAAVDRRPHAERIPRTMRRDGDRRAQVRLDVVGALWGAIELRKPAQVINISEQGALLLSPVPMTPGTVHTVEIARGHQALMTDIRVRHAAPADDGLFAVGVEFIGPVPEPLA